MYKDAAMILVPPADAEPLLLANVEKMLSPCRFGRMTVTTAENHDRMIAFSSQMAHVVSNAFVKSPSARQHKGYSAGSYKDMTRVAWLNENMWSELCMENRDNLAGEIDLLIASLTEYKSALESGDREKLTELLRSGRIAKEQADGTPQ
jgi:prephenate dehydrogenase